MNKKLLKQAVGGDTGALKELRQTVQPHLTVFVVSEGKVNTAATLEAFAYFQENNYPPEEWDDAPTLTLAQAFVQRVRRNPLTLRPVTPGVWSKLWDTDDGHKLVAAIHWGVAHGHIRESALSLKGRVRNHMERRDQFLLDIVTEMERDEAQANYAMGAVLCPVEREQPATPPPSPRQQGQAAAQDALEAAYQRGEVDISRYLKLKATPSTSEWSHEKYIALNQMIKTSFSLSEIQGLIFDMGLDRDNFSKKRDMAAMGLSQWAKRRGQLDKLSGLVKRANPNRWIEFAAEWS